MLKGTGLLKTFIPNRRWNNLRILLHDTRIYVLSALHCTCYSLATAVSLEREALCHWRILTGASPLMWCDFIVILWELVVASFLLTELCVVLQFSHESTAVLLVLVPREKIVSTFPNWDEGLFSAICQLEWCCCECSCVSTHALVSVQQQKFVLTVFWFCVMNHVLQFREIAHSRVHLCYDMNVSCKALTSAVFLMSCVLSGLPYSRLEGDFFASDIKMYTEIHGVCCQGCLIYDVYNIYINGPISFSSWIGWCLPSWLCRPWASPSCCGTNPRADMTSPEPRRETESYILWFLFSFTNKGCFLYICSPFCICVTSVYDYVTEFWYLCKCRNVPTHNDVPHTSVALTHMRWYVRSHPQWHCII